jgi:transcription factor STE12
MVYSNFRRRHRRIHEAQQDGQPVVATEEDLDNEGNDFDSAGEEASPPAPAHTKVSMPAMTTMGTSMGIPSAVPTMMAPQMIAPQLLQQQI